MPKIDINQLTKRYYSIGEVANLFGLSTSVIRFWEKEFDEIKPHKNSKGDRRFTPENIMQVQWIYELIKERGFTINGAKQEILRRKEWLKNRKRRLKELQELRNFLQDIKEQIQQQVKSNNP